jgi:hypothetical protein
MALLATVWGVLLMSGWYRKQPSASTPQKPSGLLIKDMTTQTLVGLCAGSIPPMKYLHMHPLWKWSPLLLSLIKRLQEPDTQGAREEKQQCIRTWTGLPSWAAFCTLAKLGRAVQLGLLLQNTEAHTLALGKRNQRLVSLADDENVRHSA